MVKQGYFFTLDALIAVGVLIAGMIWILSINTYVPSQTQTTFTAEDSINTIANIRLYELNSRYVDMLVDNGTVTRKDNTLLEQVGEFYYRNDLPSASSFVENVSSGQIPQQYGFELLIDGNSIYASSTTSNTTALLISKKVIISGIANRTLMYGPYEAEVRVWQ